MYFLSQESTYGTHIHEKTEVRELRFTCKCYLHVAYLIGPFTFTPCLSSSLPLLPYLSPPPLTSPPHLFTSSPTSPPPPLTSPFLPFPVATVHDIVSRGGRCLIPVFALGRAQELLLILG